MKREEALALVESYVDNENLVKHMLAVEAIMGRLAQEFDTDRDKWSLAGLLHDVDYDLTKDEPEEHGRRGAQILEEQGVDREIIQAVRAHNPTLGENPETLMDKALYATDPLTGLIVAAALVHPDKKLESIDTGFVMNRFSEGAFARGADRDQIRSCSELGLELEEFVSLGLEAMQGVAEELGL